MRVRIRETEFELELTTFINLMIVLLSFLLVSAVLKEVAVLQVNLPASGGGAAAEAKKPLLLEVIVYRDRLMVTDAQSGPLKAFPDQTPGQHDYAAVNKFLRQLKQQYPAVTESSILLEQDTPYDNLVHTMDAIRYYVDDINGNPIKRAMFPDIAIGDAPADPNRRP